MSARLSKQDKLGLWLIAASVFVVIAAVVATFIIKQKQGSAQHDPTSLCPYAPGYAHTIVIVDWTDPFSESQQRLFRSKILQIRQSLHPLEKLSIYVLDDKNYLAPIPAFAICNPGSGKDVNPLYQNPRMAENLYQQRFGKPLDEIVEKLSSAPTAKTSPILEMVHSVSQVFDFGPNAGGRRLILFSDMMQNMPEYSHFSQRFGYDAFRATSYARRLNADLKDVRVEAVYLLRPELYKYQSQPGHQAFWGNWFEEHGAREVVFQRAS
jgi:hypothetical protein